MPQDPFMLLGVINMKLRDFYPSLEALCDDLDLNREELCAALQTIGMEYNPKTNKFW